MVYSVPKPGVDAIENPERDAAYIALLEKIGEPVIWMGWSRGGLMGQRLVTQRPDLFKALAFVEGCTQEYSNVPTFIQTLVSRHIPMLQVNPDYAWRAFRVPPLDTPSGTRCKGLAEEINARGGNAAAVYLPDVGFRGNGHEFMLQNNADQILEKVYLPWLKKNVK
jgi:pimeloyl-ACP methyl ester carboxylesterase